MNKFEITKVEGGTAFLVQVNQGAANVITKKDNDMVYIDLTVDPNKGNIDDSLSAFLVEQLGTKPQNVIIPSGSSATKKIVIVMNVTPEVIEQRLQPPV